MPNKAEYSIPYNVIYHKNFCATLPVVQDAKYIPTATGVLKPFYSRPLLTMSQFIHNNNNKGPESIMDSTGA
jgi:hypothetical protein